LPTETPFGQAQKYGSVKLERVGVLGLKTKLFLKILWVIPQRKVKMKKDC